MAARDFDAGRPSREVHSFTICGERFLARPTLSWRSFARMIDAVQMPTSTTEEAAEKLRLFFQTVLMPSDREKFLALFDDEEREDPIDLESVWQVVNWLLEVYGGKAGGPSASSEPGSPSTEESSTESSDLQATGTDSIPSIPRVVRL